MIGTLYPLARRLLFLLDPESAHEVSMPALRLAERLHLLAPLAGPPPAAPVECMGLHFPNPVGLAAGLDKEGNTIDALGRLGFGFLEIGTITPRPQPGNPKPRLFRLVPQRALINRMGFNNPGIDAGAANVRSTRGYRGVIGFNIGKNKDTPNERAADDYLACLRAAWPLAGYVAVNLSSPNTPGLRDLQAADTTARLLDTLRQEQSRLAAETGHRVPVVFKVAPDLGDEQIEALATVFLDGGLDGLIATNTTIARDAVQGARHAGESGGLSGPPLLARSTEVLAAFASRFGGRIPLIASGGIASADDALAKFRAGASLVQIYTAFIYQGPRLIREIVAALPPPAPTQG